MSLNNLKPNPGSRRSANRVGRGIGSGSGKTGGRGHKGQKARSGGFHKVGFEGGQMPIQRRLPKFGFTSRMGRHYAEVRLHELAKVPEGEITPATLIEAGIVPLQTKTIKIILSGEVGKAVKVSGCRVTKGARSAIESAGGSVDDAPIARPARSAEADEGTGADTTANVAAAESQVSVADEAPASGDAEGRQAAGAAQGEAPASEEATDESSAGESPSDEAPAR